MTYLRSIRRLVNWRVSKCLPSWVSSRSRSWVWGGGGGGGKGGGGDPREPAARRGLPPGNALLCEGLAYSPIVAVGPAAVLAGTRRADYSAGKVSD